MTPTVSKVLLKGKAVLYGFISKDPRTLGLAAMLMCSCNTSLRCDTTRRTSLEWLLFWHNNAETRNKRHKNKTNIRFTF